MLRRQCSTLPLTWLKQCASIMRPTAYQISVSMGELSRKAGFLVDRPSQTNIWYETVHVVGIGVSRRSAESFSSTGEMQKGSQPIATIDDDTVGPSLDVQVTLQYGRYCNEIKLNFLQIENAVFWVVIKPRIRQIRETAFGRKHKLIEYVNQFTNGS